MSKAKTVREILQAAKWILQNHNWRQGSFHKIDEHGNHSFCVAGAMSAVERSDEVRLYSALNLLESIATGGRENIASWNDAPGRTKKQVLALFNKAIKKADYK